MVINGNDIRDMAGQCLRRLLNEISSADAYNRFYGDLCAPGQWEAFMAGAPTITPFHKAALDAMTHEGKWDEELAASVPKAWTGLDNDGRKYLVDFVKMRKSRGGDLSSSDLRRLVMNALKMEAHSEAKMAGNGIVTLAENDMALITCTLNYTASQKYYGDSHWCTASGIDGRFDGFSMFNNYVIEDGACLIQLVDKRDRKKSAQISVNTFGDIVQSFDYMDKVIDSDDDVYAWFRDRGLDPEEFFKKTDFLELCKRSEEATARERDYWRERSAAYNHKMALAASASVDNGAYDDGLLQLMRTMFQKLGWVYGGDYRPEGYHGRHTGFRLAGRTLEGDFIVRVRIGGANDRETNFFDRIDDTWLESDALKHVMYMFTVSSDLSRVTKRVKGINPLKVIGNLVLCAVFDDGDGEWMDNYFDIINAVNGKTVATGIEKDYKYTSEKILYAPTYDAKYESNLWLKIDAVTGNILGRIKGSLSENTMRITENDIKAAVNECVRKLLNEISSADAYNRFYRDLCEPEQWERFMAGAPTMTPVHKTALDIMRRNGKWDESLSTIVANSWSSLSPEGRQFVLNRLKNAEAREDGIDNRWSLMSIMASAAKKTKFSENAYCKDGLFIIRETDRALVTCTTSYAASKKYYGDSQWCTASDVTGRYDGFKMFKDYTTEEDTILVQFVNKNDRGDSIQVQLSSVGVESACDFADRPIRYGGEGNTINGHLERMGLPGDICKQITDNADLWEKLYQKTSNDTLEEEDYWEDKYEAYAYKMKKKFNENVAGDIYDKALLAALSKVGEYTAMRTLCDIGSILKQGDDQYKGPFGTFIAKQIPEGGKYVLVNFDAAGVDASEDNFLVSLDNHWGDCDYTASMRMNAWVIETDGGWVGENSRVVNKFKGHFNRCSGVLAITETYDYLCGEYSSNIVNIIDGTTLAEDVIGPVFSDGVLKYFADGDDRNNNVVSVLDPKTGEYLGKKNGKLG